MTKEREIINEKLNTIDYGLNVDAMWGELEYKLPPEKRKRKFTFLWMWTGLALLLLVAGFFYIQKQFNREVYCKY